MLGSNASNAFNTDLLWWFYAVSIPHGTVSGPRHGGMFRHSPWFSALGIFEVDPFSTPLTMQCKNPFRFCLWSSCSQAKKRHSTSLGFNSYGTQFLCFWIIPMALRHFEIAYWVTPNDSANFSYLWHESSTSNASNSESTKVFSFPPTCRLIIFWVT